MSEKTEKQNYKRKSLGFYVFTFFGFLVLILVVFTAGIYKLGWENAGAKRFAELIPLPVAVVGGKPVPLSHFWKLENASTSLTGKSASKEIVHDLVRDKIVEILATEKNIEISSQESEQHYMYLLARFGLDRSNAQQEVNRLFGMTEEDFQRLVALPDLKRIKLAVWWQEASRPNEASRRMQGLERKLLEGLTFQEGSRLESDDEESKYIGGDLGFLALEEIPPWFRDTITSLKTGDMSRVVAGPDGYYLFLAAARGQDPAKNGIQVKQIFIRNEGFEGFLDKEIARFRILVFKRI